MLTACAFVFLGALFGSVGLWVWFFFLPNHTAVLLGLSSGFWSIMAPVLHFLFRTTLSTYVFSEFHTDVKAIFNCEEYYRNYARLH